MGNSLGHEPDEQPPGLSSNPQPVISWGEAMRRSSSDGYQKPASNVTAVQNPFLIDASKTSYKDGKLTFEYTTLQDCQLEVYFPLNHMASQVKSIPGSTPDDWMLMLKGDCISGQHLIWSEELSDVFLQVDKSMCIATSPKDPKSTWAQWYYITMTTSGAVDHWECKMRCNDQIFSIFKIYSQAENEKDNGQCLICQDASAVIMVIPCRHLCLCEECSRKLDTKCPVCRGIAAQFLIVDKSAPAESVEELAKIENATPNL